MANTQKTLESRVSTLENDTQKTEHSLQELIKSQKETGSQLKEIKQLFKEISKQMKETDRKIQEHWLQIKETDRQLQKTDRQLQETDYRLNKLIGNWGRLIEALVSPSTIRLFQEWGFDAVGVNERMKTTLKDGRTIEIDAMVHNTDALILIEIKTTLHVSDVNEHIEKRLNHFHEFYPEYRHKKIFGAVAFITSDEQAERYAYKKGLFVLTLSGEGMTKILNDDSFKPKVFQSPQTS